MSNLTFSKQQIIRTGYVIACILTVVGVSSALSRYLLPHDLHVQIAGPLYSDTYTQQQFPELARRPIQEFVHRVVGAAYLIIGLLQFTPAFRKKHWKRHRILGRIFVFFSVLVGVGGMAMAIFYPFAGFRETLPTLLFGSLFLYFVYSGYRQAVARNIRQHQLWMIRSFSLALGISTIRIIFLGVNTLTDLDHRDIFVFSFWCAWTLHVVLTELGIYLAFAKRIRKAQYAG